MLAGLLPCVSSVSWAAAEAAAAGEADEEDSGGLGLSGMVILDQSVGIGSFYRADAAEIVPALSFIGRWKLPGTEDMSLSLRQDFTLYGLGSLSAYTDQDPGESMRAADTLVTFNLGQLAKDEALTGLALKGSVMFYLPTSKASRTRSLIAGVGPGLGLSRKFGFVSLSASTRARYNFQRYDNVVLTVEDEGDGVFQGCVPRGNSKNTALRDDEIGCGGSQNYDWRFYHSFGASFQITRAFSAQISMSIINSFGIPIEPDEFTSEVTLRTNNETQRDSTWGIVDLSYEVNDHLGLSAGISSLQAAKTADGEHLRFPWWDFEGPQNNSTSLYFDVIGSF